MKRKDGEFAVVARVKKGSVRDKAVAKALEDFMDYEASIIYFATVYLSKGADPKKDSSLTMQRHGFRELGEAPRIVMQGAWSQTTIAKWVMHSTYPLVDISFK